MPGIQISSGKHLPPDLLPLQAHKSAPLPFFQSTCSDFVIPGPVDPCYESGRQATGLHRDQSIVKLTTTPCQFHASKYFWIYQALWLMLAAEYYE